MSILWRHIPSWRHMPSWRPTHGRQVRSDRGRVKSPSLILHGRNRPPTTDHQPPTSDHQPRSKSTTDHQPSTTDHRPPTTVKTNHRPWLKPTTDHGRNQPPTTDYGQTDHGRSFWPLAAFGPWPRTKTPVLDYISGMPPKHSADC